MSANEKLVFTEKEFKDLMMKSFMEEYETALGILQTTKDSVEKSIKEKEND